MTLYKKTCEYCSKEFLVKDPRTRFCCRECGYENRRTLKGQNIYHLRLYHIYTGIKYRCYNTSSKDYKRYGERGITMCESWLNCFKNFYDWAMSNGYTDDLTIDRIDVNGNYTPENCRWVNNFTQSNNKRNNIIITYKNETHTIAEWSKITKMSYHKLWGRYQRGCSIEEIFSKNEHKKYPSQTKFVTYNGQTHCLAEWDEIKNFPKDTISRRLSKGWSIEEAITKEPDQKYNKFKTKGK